MIPPYGGVPGVARSSIRQESVLAEAIDRIRSHTNLPFGQKYERPLIVVLNKVDSWLAMLGPSQIKLPLVGTDDGFWALHQRRLMAISDGLRSLLMTHIPELVYTAEEFAKQVIYLPASSLGRTPSINDNGVATIRPSEIRPSFVTIPMLLGLAMTTHRTIPVWQSNNQRSEQSAHPASAATRDNAELDSSELKFRPSYEGAVG